MGRQPTPMMMMTSKGPVSFDEFKKAWAAGLVSNTKHMYLSNGDIHVIDAPCECEKVGYSGYSGVVGYAGYSGYSGRYGFEDKTPTFISAFDGLDECGPFPTRQIEIPKTLVDKVLSTVEPYKEAALSFLRKLLNIKDPKKVDTQNPLC
ncbi:Uncharacterised protein [uncultured archaeon]|nr:Uncharacterised protein [uncultured archaeon]